MIETEYDTSEVTALKRRELELLRKKLDIIKSNGINFYNPHYKQDLFHRAGDFRYRYGRTGNGFGKSLCGSAEDVAWAMGERVWLPKGDPDRTKGIPQRPTKGLVVTIDWDKSEEVFTSQRGEVGFFFKWLPKDLIDRTHRNTSGKVDAIFLKNGSSIYIDTVQSFKSNAMSQESSAWDWCHIDEPCPRLMFIAILRGLAKRNGSAWVLCTPITEVWINDFFIASRQTKLAADLPTVTALDKWVMLGSIYDNPYLNPDAIKAFEDTLTQDEKACRLYGIPLAMSGLVYKEFSDDRHILRKLPPGWKDYDDPPSNYTIRYAIDPHPRTPHAVLFVATAPTGEHFFFHEIFDQCTIADLSYRIKSRIAGRFVALAMVDPIAYIQSPINDLTWADEFIANGLFLQKAPKDLAHGIQATKAALRLPGNLFFSPHLTRTRYEFDHYIWDEQKDKPKDADDHMMENLYRLVISGLDYIEPPSDEDYQILKETSDFSLTTNDL